MIQIPSYQTYLLAQTDSGDSPPVPTPGETTTGEAAPGDGGAANGADAAPIGGSPFTMMWLLLVVVVVMIVFSMMGQRRERKKREAMLGAIKKHDRVQTIGGVIGSIVEVKSNSVVLKVDESSNTRITFARSAVQQVLDERGGTKGEASKPDLANEQ